MNHTNEIVGSHVTEGEWPDEPSACDALDEILARTQLFSVHKECTGRYLFRLAGDSEPRIDRILVPTAMLLSLGWNLGIVGIECKASGVKLGPVVSQGLDYSRAVFPVCGTEVLLRWIFIWPLNKYFNDLASIMTQNRIGGAWTSKYALFDLRVDALHLLKYSHDGNVELRAPVSGQKVGSR